MEVIQSVVAPLRSEIDGLRREIEELRATGAPRILSVDQACKQLGVKRTKFYELLAHTDLGETQADLPRVSQRHFDRELLFAWIERHSRVAQRKQTKTSRRRRPSASRLQKEQA
jgi:excisionase family DNA binding protein